MKTARHIALAAAVATMLACTEEPVTPPVGLWDEEAWRVLSGLIEMANEAEAGTGTYPCALGGEASVTVAINEEQLGDTARTFRGRWAFDMLGCRLVTYPRLASSGDVTFTSEWTVFESWWRVKAALEADFYAEYSHSPRYVETCDGRFPGAGRNANGTDLSVVAEGSDEDDFPDSFDGIFCGVAVEIPLSDFPGFGG
ncbi:MAG: hypothetical protein J4F34_08555 [Gemmatimonadetes bacterium]|nr:hypothetical protein [Gemmatimonadota bacterium]